MHPVSATLPCPQPDPPRADASLRPLNVVIVDEELPYPANSGKRIRTLNLTLRLARRHRITYLCHRNADASEAERAATFFAEQGIDTVIIDRAVPPRHGAAFYARLAANLFSSQPYSVTSHNSRELRCALREYAATHPVDLWHCEWTPYAAALQALPNVRRLVMAHNVESLIWQRYYETETNPIKRWYIKKQWQKYLRFERWAVTSADQAVAVSPVDAQFFAEQFGARGVRVVDNGVDIVSFRPTGQRRDSRRLLFLGSLDWRPNLDAVEQLLSVIFPAVRVVEPDVRLWLVGRNPPGELRSRVQDLPGVELHADVADVRPFLHAAGVLVVPLRIGGGSRLKILEALASGLPVVSTRVGAEGLALDPGRHLTVVDSIEEMSSALGGYLGDPQAAQSQADEGRQRVRERYDWDILADRLDHVWRECAGRAVHA